MIENGFKEITCSLYGGQGLFSKAHNPYESHTVFCSASASCSLYQNKQCLSAQRLNFKKCIFGKLITEKGTSYRAKSYYDLKTKTIAKESYGELNSADVRFAYINGYYYVDMIYAQFWKYLSTNEYRILSPHDLPYNSYTGEEEKKNWGLLGKYHFFGESELTADILKTILEFKPKALFGGTINEYQEKVIPQMKAEILKFAPDLAKDIGIEKINYVGMMGQLATLNAPIDFQKDGLQYHWDGEYVITTDVGIIDSYKTSTTWTKAIGNPVEAYAKFKPFNELFVEIENDDWVKPDSVVKTK